MWSFASWPTSFPWRWLVLGGAVLFFGTALARKCRKHKKLKENTSQTVHRGIICSSCNDVIRGIRYMCANCTDYDVCEACEKKDVHYKTHVFLKIRIPIPALAIPPGALLPVLYPGNCVGFFPLFLFAHLLNRRCLW
jgi:hypothetical protein